MRVLPHAEYHHIKAWHILQSLRDLRHIAISTVELADQRDKSRCSRTIRQQRSPNHALVAVVVLGVDPTLIRQQHKDVFPINFSLTQQ